MEIRLKGKGKKQQIKGIVYSPSFAILKALFGDKAKYYTRNIDVYEPSGSIICHILDYNKQFGVYYLSHKGLKFVYYDTYEEADVTYYPRRLERIIIKKINKAKKFGYKFTKEEKELMEEIRGIKDVRDLCKQKLHELHNIKIKKK